MIFFININASYGLLIQFLYLITFFKEYTSLLEGIIRRVFGVYYFRKDGRVTRRISTCRDKVEGVMKQNAYGVLCGINCKIILDAFDDDIK
jgi:hypothetical protein